jgi:hypothetical protein
LSKTMPEWVTRLNSVLPFWLGYGWSLVFGWTCHRTESSVWIAECR